MTNEELTAIYNAANGLDPKRHTPITTERIFAAMHAAMAVEREACAKVCEALSVDEKYPAIAVHYEGCAAEIRKRSNVEFRGGGAATPNESTAAVPPSSATQG